MSRLANKWRQQQSSRGIESPEFRFSSFMFSRLPAGRRLRLSMLEIKNLLTVKEKHSNNASNASWCESRMKNKLKQWPFLTKWLHTRGGATFGLILNPALPYPNTAPVTTSWTKHRGSFSIFICYFWVAGANRHQIRAQMETVIMLQIAGYTDESRRLMWASRRVVVLFYVAWYFSKSLLNHTSPD